jgi:integrase
VGKKIEKPHTRIKLAIRQNGLDKSFIEKVELPRKGAVTYWDNDPRVPGFGLRVYAAGGKSFFLNYHHGGRERRYTIGAFPRWSVTAARERAKELRIEIDRDHDPAGQKRERREAPTVQDLVDRYIVDHLPTKAASKHNDDKAMLAEIARHLGSHTKVADIHGGDIAKMHRKISESIGRYGPRRVRANRVLAVCSKMFSLSLVPRAGENAPWRDAVQGNPCKGIKRNHEEGRERFFSQLELTAISDALAKYPGIAADCVRLIMLTGCRPAEALKASWIEFDAEPGYWCKSSANTKQRKSHKLPLSPAALELVARLRKERIGNWAFPGAKPSEHLAALWHVWRFVREETGLGKDARIYDLRHTFASIGAGGGLSLPIIGRLLGHTQPRTTQRYAHLADDPLREAAEKITTVITGAGKPSAEVASFKERGAR